MSGFYQDILLSSKKYKREKAYWLDKLGGNLSETNLIYDYQLINRDLSKMDQVRFDFSEDLNTKLMKFCKGMDISLYIILLTGLKCTLNRYTGNQDLTIGSPVYNLNSSDDLHNKLVALRDELTGEMTFKESLLKVRKTTLEAYENQHYPFEKIAEYLDIEPIEGRLPIINILSLLTNIHDEEIMEQYNFDLICVFKRDNEEITGEVIYSLDAFKKTTINQFARHVISLLNAALDNIDGRLADLIFFESSELNELRELFNQTTVDYPADKTIVQLFEEQVEKNPDEIAVVFEDQQLTYRELNEKSNQVAGVLRKRGIVGEKVVGVMMDRSIEMVTGIMGVLKSGGAYLPIDPTYPQKRVLTMLDDTKASILLANKEGIKGNSYISLQKTKSCALQPLTTCPRSQIDDLDNFPLPDRSLVDYKKYSQYVGNAMVKNIISIQDSRGCPYNCAYCHKVWPKKYINRSAEHIFQEIKTYYEAGFKRFNFINDVFNLNLENSSRFFELIIEHKMDVQLFFPSGFRGDRLTKDYIDLMVEAGTVNMALALETASPRLQKLIRKNLDIEKFRDNIEYIIEKHPHVILELFTMHGLPTETEEEAMMTLDFIKSLKWVHFPYINILKSFPNTDMATIAVESGISMEAIERSAEQAFHELPDTLPFPKSFAREYQAKFLKEYVLDKDRLLKLIPLEMKTLTEDELLQKYNSYLPATINSFDDLLEYSEITREELGDVVFAKEEDVAIPDNINERLKIYSTQQEPSDDALKVLLLDFNQYYSAESNNMLYDVVEAPLGLMSLLSHLNHNLPDQIHGKIQKSRIDFDSDEELRVLIQEFRPDVIGISCLTYYRNFLHRTVAQLRQNGIDIPIVVGGPYATSSYDNILQDRNVDIVVIGEGELTFTELITKMLENNKRLPEDSVLKEINGIAFVDRKATRLPDEFEREIIIFDDIQELLADQPVENLDRINKPDDLAYIIYTSGSTGKPKGVMVEHKNVVNLVKWFSEKYNITTGINVLQNTNISFDVAVEEIFGTLTIGGRLYIPTKETTLDKNKMLSYIQKHQINLAQFVPVTLKEFLADADKIESLNVVICGGEKLNDQLKDEILTLGYNLYNHYGPTETTVDAITTQCETEKVTIGRPINNTKVYIFDQYNNLQPVGAVGEICIAGESVARGYLNDSVANVEKFVQDPFTAPGKKMYRTGDLGRWLPDQTLEFLGRIDDQVKIRGFRIELSEIESHMVNYEGVKESVVIDRVHEVTGNKYLCGYIVANKTISINELREHLATELPHYMIPAYFIEIDKIPLTSNGKLNRKALPEPQEVIDSSNDYVAPHNEMEKKLVTIWSEVLDISAEKIGITDNFFELGGHSLKVIKVVSRIHKEFNIKIGLGDLFKAPTIQELCYMIGNTQSTIINEVQIQEEQEYYEVSYAQQRFWLHSQLEEKGVLYNAIGAYRVKGDIEQKLFSDTWQMLVERHESLQTVFATIDGDLKQKIRKYTSAPVIFMDFRGADDPEDSVLAEVTKESSIAFDLKKGPLFKVILIQIDDAEHILLLKMHHIISDGWSMAILMNEFYQVYGALCKGKANPLPRLKIQYRDYAAWQKRFLSGQRLEDHRQYWLDQFKGELPVLNLPTDQLRPAVKTFNGNNLYFTFTKENIKKIEKLTQKLNVTKFMILLSIVQILLHKYSKHDDIIIGIDVVGRNQKEFEDVVGAFVNTLGLRLNVNQNDTYESMLSRVKEVVLGAYEHQEYPFDLLISDLEIKRDVKRSALFDVMVSLNNISQVKTSEDNLQFSNFEINLKTTYFDLMFVFVEDVSNIGTYISYNTDLFDLVTIELMKLRFVALLENILENPKCMIADLTLMTPVEGQLQKINEIDDLEFDL